MWFPLQQQNSCKVFMIKWSVSPADCSLVVYLPQWTETYEPKCLVRVPSSLLLTTDSLLPRLWNHRNRRRGGCRWDLVLPDAVVCWGMFRAAAALVITMPYAPAVPPKIFMVLFFHASLLFRLLVFFVQDSIWTISRSYKEQYGEFLM